MTQPVHYLDHAATTPMVPEALAALTDQLARPGNASSLHASGRRARMIVEESRERIAAALGARPSEVVFTSGGTESDNLAVKGAYAARHGADPRRTRVLASAIEHHAVLDCVDYLAAEQGARPVWVEPDSGGVITLDAVRDAIETDPQSVALVAVMWANNEVGTVQPVPEIASVCHEYGIPLHTDAVQAAGHIEVDFERSGADLMAITAHKLGGPVGVGALLARRDAPVATLSHGGGQERDLRSGTLDTAGVSAFAAAVEVAVTDRQVEAKRLVTLRDRVIEGAMALGLGITPGGRWTAGDGTTRLPGNAHLLVPDCEGDSLLYLLDAAGIECSTGSACRAGVSAPSFVLMAMGMSEQTARGALRVTLGHNTTEQDVDALLAALPAVVQRARRAHGAGR